MTPIKFVELLQSLSFENTFNPYVDRCEIHDAEHAPVHRREALLSILQVAVKSEIDAIWIGRDLGYRGGRRTGLALTDDVHMSAHAARWGLKFIRPTNGKPVAEKTADVIWKILEQIEAHIFLWNVFPLHPHSPLEPFTNRAHTSTERRAGEEVLFALIKMLKPKTIIAIGNDAASSVTGIYDTSKIIKVRHPSYGGQTQFLDQICSHYKIINSSKQLNLL